MIPILSRQQGTTDPSTNIAICVYSAWQYPQLL